MLASRHHAALPSHVTPAELTPRLVAAFADVNARLRRAIGRVAPTQRDAPRTDGGWSAHQVLEHIVITNEGYLDRLLPLASTLEALPAAAVVWRPTFRGKWLARSLEMRLPLPAPRVIQPGPHPRANVLDAAIATHDAVCRLMERTAQRDWCAARLTSPFSSAVRPNFGDACVVMLRHSERHAAQIEQLG